VASRGWSGAGGRGCGSQLRPRADPGATPSATTGPAWVRAPWNAKAGKAGGALDRRVSSSGVCSGAPHPLTFGGTGKETGKPQARPNLGPFKLGCLTIEYNERRSADERPPALQSRMSLRSRGHGAEHVERAIRTGREHRPV